MFISLFILFKLWGTLLHKNINIDSYKSLTLGFIIILIFVAFGAGLLSFLSPCVLPLIPGYISYISGQTLNELVEKRQSVLLKTIYFSLGFSIVFIIFGLTASFLGKLFITYSKELRMVAGIIIILFSLQLIGIIKLNLLNKEKKYYTKK